MTAPRVALLINPTAGKGRGARVPSLVAPRLRDAGYDVRQLVGRDADEALDLARQCVAEGVETLAAVGGDGMVHLALQAVAGTQTRLGLIPTGTGNDVARLLDIPRKDPLAAADVVIGGRERSLDLARVGDRWFVTVLAAGFDAIVNERANRMGWPRGQARYNLATVAELRGLHARPYTIEVDGQTHHFHAVGVAIGNGPSYGGGMRICEGATPDDGLLDVVVIGDITRRELLRTFPLVFKGTHLAHPDVTVLRGRSVTVAAPGIVAYADGERVGSLPLTVEVVPGALTVLAP